MYFDIGLLAVTYSREKKMGKSSGKGLRKSGLAPPKSNKSIWIYAGRAKSRIHPSDGYRGDKSYQDFSKPGELCHALRLRRGYFLRDKQHTPAAAPALT